MQEAFRGVPACQGPGNRSLPGKARGFRGQDTVDCHGGFDVVMEEVVQREQENPASNARKMIDDFRLAGSRPWRRRGGPPAKKGGPTEVAHFSATHNATLSEGGVLAVVVRDFPETPHQTRDNTAFPPPMRQGEARLRFGCPLLARRGGAPYGRDAGGESDPFLALMRHREGAGGPMGGPPAPPRRGEVALTTVIPTGRPT